MKSKMFVATSVAALLVGTVVAWPILTAPAESPSDGTDTPTVTGAGVESRDKGSAQPGADDRRTLAPKTPAAAKEGDPQAAPVITIRGRLVDADAAPLAGRTVGFTTSTKWSLPDAKSAPTQTTRTADRGRFELEIPTTTGRIKVHDTGWRTVLAAVMDENPQREALVVAAPVIPLAGKVVDEAGRAVVDAAVQIVLPASFFTRFDDVHDTATDDFLRHRSGGDGSFEIADACFIDKADLEITKPGFRNLRVRLPRAGNPSLVVRLKRTDSADNTITGQVLDQRGQVVADAWVTLGRTSTKSDDQGNFALELPKSGPADTLMAIKRGSLPARLKKVDDASNWPTPVVLRLGGPPLSIAGRVLDAAGNGVPSVKVWVYDGEFAGRVDQTTSTVQGLVTGGATRSVVMRMIREGGQEPRDVLRRTPTAMWPFTRTTASGAFRIDGLGKRNYALRAILDDTLLMVEKAGVAGGSTGVVLQFAKDSYYPKLSGIVISKKGHPIADAEIYTMCDPARVAVRNGGSTTQHQTAQNTRTDEAGRFEFQNVPRRLVYLRVDHKDVLSVEYGRSNEGGLAALVGNNTDNMVIEVQVRIHVNITVHDPAKADSFSALDAAGKTLPINQFKGKSRRTLRRQPLHDGKSGVVVVPETATRLVFYKGKTKVDEIDIDLVPGRVNEIQR